MKVVMPMIFLSNLLRQNVYDTSNHRVGVLNDVCVALNETFPVVTGLVVSPASGNHRIVIPWSQVQTIEETPVHLSVDRARLADYTPEANELLLKRDILDKQIVDTQGFRVVKVNDLKLAQIKKTARLVGVDISSGGLLRRLGIMPVINALGHILPIHLPERTITWNYVEPIQRAEQQLTPALAGASAGGGMIAQVQLNVSHNKLAELRPADIADILEQLDLAEAEAVLGRLDTETAADTLNEIEYPRQSELLSGLDPERVSDLLEKLAPDDAADILADIPRGEAEHILNLMPTAESQPIRDLLRYGAETAGGIMTNEVLALAQGQTVADALLYLRQHSTELEMIYYLYALDEQRHLNGVVSLRQLVTSEPGTPLRDIMDSDVIRVTADTDQEEVARIIAKYDLLGVPVVDADNHLLGLVTVDDVIDVIHEEQAEDISEIAGADVEEAEDKEAFSLRTALSRFSWLAVNVVAGFALALLIHQLFTPLFSSASALASTSGLLAGLQTHLAFIGTICLLPMLLLTSGSAGSQALGIAGWQLRSQSGKDFWRGFWREIQQGTFGGILASLLAGLLTWLLFHSLPLALLTALGFGLTLLVAYICGLGLPNLLQRLRLRGSLITAPLLDPVIAVVSLTVFLLVVLTLADRLTI